MWCPSATLAVWANAWLAGQAAPDDVLDELSRWAPVQSVAAHDAISAGNAGLPGPGGNGAGSVTLLHTLRAAASRRPPPDAAGRSGPVHPVFPVPGDVRGLLAGTRFEQDALVVGEAVAVTGPDGSAAVGLIPDFTGAPDPDAPSALSWTVYDLPGVPVVEEHDLGDAEYALRSAVRAAADALGAAGGWYSGDAEPRLLVEQLVETSRQHRIPEHAPMRAARALENAAHVDAIITVCSGLSVAGVHSAAAMQRVAETVRPLAGTVRAARAAAVDVILRSAWHG